MRRNQRDLCSLIREKVAGDAASERTYAIGLLSKIQGHRCTDVLRERLEHKTGKKVRAELLQNIGSPSALLKARYVYSLLLEQ